MRLPSPRCPGRYRLATVCLGNICRSPMAAVVLQRYVDGAGLSGGVEVTSAGTGPWHVGERMDERAASTLSDRGLDPSRHRGQQVDGAWFDRDLLLAMDSRNHADLLGLADREGVDATRVRMFRDFDPYGPGDVPDPYFGGPEGFTDTYTMVDRTAAALVRELTEML